MFRRPAIPARSVPAAGMLASTGHWSLWERTYLIEGPLSNLAQWPSILASSQPFIDLGGRLPQRLAMANSFGHLFRITTWGESHGGGVGVVVDGCPPKLELSEADIQPDLDRRRPGQSKIVTPRQEPDRVEILSGVFEGKTLGTPIMMWVRNQDARPE